MAKYEVILQTTGLAGEEHACAIEIKSSVAEKDVKDILAAFLENGQVRDLLRAYSRLASDFVVKKVVRGD